MNSTKMNDILASMARESNVSMNVCTGVIASINSDYNKSNCCEQNALETFRNFLEA